MQVVDLTSALNPLQNTIKKTTQQMLEIPKEATALSDILNFGELFRQVIV